MTDIQVLVDCANMLGENPLWDVEEQRFYWVDGMGHQIWRCADDGSDVRSWTLPESVGAIGSMALRKAGGAVLATEAGVQFFDFESGVLERIAHPEEGKHHVRINDGKIDSRGRFVFGSLDIDAVFPPDPANPGAPRGQLYRLDSDRKVHALADGIIISNGPCWSPDNSTFYLADSWADKIYAYDWDEAAGTVSNRRDFASFEQRTVPDGGTVDAEGYVWNVNNGGFSGEGALWRFAPDGTLDRKIVMPVFKPTSMIFGGPNLDVIYVTSNRLPSEVAEKPNDGAVFAIRGLGIRGLPERRFTG